MVFSKEELDQLRDLYIEEMTPVKKVLAALNDQMMALREKITLEVSSVRSENTQLREQVEQLADKLDYMENQNRRENLIITGIRETGAEPETWDATLDKTVSALGQLGVVIQKDRIHRAHRLFARTLPRPIVIKFTSYQEKERVMMESKKCLRGREDVEIVVKEDFSEAVRKQRQQLRPIQNHAYKNGHRTFFRKDKLVVDGVTFMYNIHRNQISSLVGNEAAVLSNQSVDAAMQVVQKASRSGAYGKRRAENSPEFQRRHQRPALSQDFASVVGNVTNTDRLAELNQAVGGITQPASVP
jgi:hypothetical protein